MIDWVLVECECKGTDDNSDSTDYQPISQVFLYHLGFVIDLPRGNESHDRYEHECKWKRRRRIVQTDVSDHDDSYETSEDEG